MHHNSCTDRVTLIENDKTKFSQFISNLEELFPASSWNDYSKENILKSIHNFSSIKTQTTNRANRDLSKIYDLVESKMCSNNVRNNVKKIHQDTDSVPDYFQFLNKRLDENFYSDFIVAIINYNFKNSFHIRFLNKLLSQLFCVELPKCSVKAYRERYLGTLGSADNANMRIDILVELGELGVLLIENKTKTKEHNAQTKLYYNAARARFPDDKIYCIFLTINGEKAECESFETLNYSDLYRIMLEEYVKEPFLTDDEIIRIAPFLKELESSFFLNDIKIINKAKAWRRRVS